MTVRGAVLLLGLFALFAIPACAEEGDTLIGLWATEPTDQGFAHVRMTRIQGAHGEEYQGEIVWLSQPLFPPSEGPALAGKPKTDRNNPDPAMHERPIVGLRLAWGFRYDGDGRWVGGHIYDPESGKTYRAKITLDDDGSLRVRGFVGVALLGRTTVWTPAEPSGAQRR